MSDFNKGDFTQQGVDGHVRATLRLNEKRYVNLDLTTNENARGCTISGNVHDQLNNLDYPIGAAPSGNIEITENGENINVAPYATATVNVAGESLKKNYVTLINETDGPLSVIDFITDLSPIIDGCLDRDYYYDLSVEPNESLTVTGLFERVITKEDPPTTIYEAGMLAGTVTFSNLVNCTIGTEDMLGYILVTDPALDASLTITATPLE